MIEKGVESTRLSVFYFGKTKPIASNNTIEGRQKNRRVEMKIAFN
jgi:outer membrane protein OmpA-like peptidoglycan-associated protein